VGRRHDLLDFDSKPEFGAFVCERAGFRCMVGEKQDWTVGTHEMKVEVALDRDRYFYVVWIRSGWPVEQKKRTAPLCLAEVYGIAVTRTVRYFKAPEQGIFKVRALLDAGLIEMPGAGLAKLPEHAPASAVATWQVIRELALVREASYQPLDETPLSAPWLARLNGSNESTIRAGKEWLEPNGFITRTSEVPARFGRPLVLWSLRRAT
jgi:hypothetical protein